MRAERSSVYGTREDGMKSSLALAAFLRLPSPRRCRSAVVSPARRYIIVGFSRAAGYDAVARVLARHSAEATSGQADVIVQNMPAQTASSRQPHVQRGEAGRPDARTFNRNCRSRSSPRSPGSSSTCAVRLDRARGERDHHPRGAHDLASRPSTNLRRRSSRRGRSTAGREYYDFPSC